MHHIRVLVGDITNGGEVNNSKRGGVKNSLLFEVKMKERKLRIFLIQCLLKTLNFRESCRIYFVWKGNHKQLLDKIFNKIGEGNAH